MNYIDPFYVPFTLTASFTLTAMEQRKHFKVVFSHSLALKLISSLYDVHIRILHFVIYQQYNYNRHNVWSFLYVHFTRVIRNFKEKYFFCDI